MNAIYNVYVFELDNAAYLLCPSIGDCSILECEFMHPDICSKHRVIKLLDTYCDIEGWQIDGLVHAFMHRYGTNNVYGGSYSKLNATSDNIKTADHITTADHIKYMVDGLNKLRERQILCDKYKSSTSMTMDYKSEIAMYNELISLQSKYHIDRTIIDDIEWLKSVIIGPTTVNLERYHNLMKKLSEIYTKAAKLFNLETGLTYSRPDTFFDSRVLPYERNVWNYNVDNDTKLNDVIKNFELAIYTMINREDEVLFDMEQINIDDIQNKYYMQQLLARHN